MTIRIGEVIAVNGTKVTLRIDDESSKETIYFEGQKYKGVSIREFISIQRGFRNVVCIVEGEYLDESKVDAGSGSFVYIRRVDVRPIGYFEKDSFYEGIKFLPMIKDIAELLPEDKIAAIYSRENQAEFIIGNMLKEDIPISLPWHRLFNSHIGIFGNTGSGKSNTLTKIYTVLFDQKASVFLNKSKFIILDFNGEYTSNQLIDANSKLVLKLHTGDDNGDKFLLPHNEFWDAETLSILFQATSNTQRPFLTRVINGRKKFLKYSGSLKNYFIKTIEKVFCTANPRPETLELTRRLASLVGADSLLKLLEKISYHTSRKVFYGVNTDEYYNANGIIYGIYLKDTVEAIDLANFDAFDELVIRANLQICNDLIQNHVQFEHIQPLLKRIDASVYNLRRVFQIDDNGMEEKILTVISLRKCNNEVKKIISLLIAKHYYHSHRQIVETPPNRTVHLIVDEAHNILSQQSAREQESWRDYRLDLFEEIIKEGRKFGVFLTISSQRPADISPTIISQLHNFFIHRLVNDRDLFLLDNTVSTLDSLSRNLIPNLGKGCCVVTGTAFSLPMVIQVSKLEKIKQPDSEDVDLLKLWGN